MSVNQHLPHVLVLPEDDANRQIANGFHKQLDWDRLGKMQVLRPAGGWSRVLDLFETEHLQAMERCSTRYLVLVLDFDEKDDRFDKAMAVIPAHLAERVFVLGTWSEPEFLKPQLKCNYESIGAILADDCRYKTENGWANSLLKHNSAELKRLRDHVAPVLFSGT